MTVQNVEFQYLTGLSRPIFRNARLRGSWDNGRYSDTWTEIPMQETKGEDGCPMFSVSVALDLSEKDKTFKWGVILDGPQGANFWGIPTEVQDAGSCDRYRQFRLQDSGTQVEQYYLTYNRRLGANKHSPPGAVAPLLRFGVWAPNAKKVEVVFGDPASGYITDAGGGIDASKPVVGLSDAGSGIWYGVAPGIFADYLGLPYMYRITTAKGQLLYRTDIFSRSQIGKGNKNPKTPQDGWPGTAETLDGTLSCSLVIDPDRMRSTFESAPPGTAPDLVPEDEFWANEFTPGLPVPTRLEDMIIYELHVGTLGYGRPSPGNLADALAFLDHLVTLGVNALEVMPLAEFNGTVHWGYGNSHHLCIESSAGGRDKYRHFVRECHRRGIAVIQDVVYNHYAHDAERAEWQYDSDDPEKNIYYWYEGTAPDGGYLDNGSTEAAPRYWEETVRQQFITGAAFLIKEMHVDGLRVDLTQAIHRDNNLRGRAIASANIFGQKLLREWSRTLHMIRPTAMLIAEEHCWDDVTKLPSQGGLGFDARWDVAFYHNLVGDSDMAGGKARLLKYAGTDGCEALGMDSFSASLYASQYNRVVFHESHDECGNSKGTARTMVVAVNWAPLVGATRIAAECRTRLCSGLSMLSAGTPMFFMGECIGAQKFYCFDNFISNKEDILSERAGNGMSLFHFYQDLITLRRRFSSLRSRNIDIVHQSNDNRTIAFKRWSGDEQVIVVASFNKAPFASGYHLQKDSLAIPVGWWKEIFNSDATIYGGHNVGNCGATVPSSGGHLNVVIPANGFAVFMKQ